MFVRPAIDSDAWNIAVLHVRGWQLGYRGQLPQELLDGLRPDDRFDRWRTTLAEAELPHHGVLVAEHDGRLLGFASVGPSSDADAADQPAGYVPAFYVEPTRWRSGIGRLLMNAAVDQLRQAGHTRATLYVLDGNERAIAFYTALGWRPDGVTKQDTRGAHTFLDVRYALDLSASTGSARVP